MKVLIDQNISHRIIPHISFLFKELAHVRTLSWINWSDYDIFVNAQKLGFDAIITLDDDFYKLLMEHGNPPKIIWLKTRNHSTIQLAKIIISHQDSLQDFFKKPSFECLEIYA